MIGVHGRRRRSRSQGHRQRSSRLPDKERGEETINTQHSKNTNTTHVKHNVDCALTQYKVYCSEREFIRGELPAPGDYRTGCPEGGIMPEVSWTSDKRRGGVSVLVELF